VYLYKEVWTQNFDPGRTSYIYTTPSFYLNYNKTHKSGLEYEIKYILYKTGQKVF